MGDLSWDAFEPSDGRFEFTWFDRIMDQMKDAGIKVVLDIGGSPAPIWLHDKCPSVNVVNEQGTTVHPAERYQKLPISDLKGPICRNCRRSCASPNVVSRGFGRSRDFYG